MKSDQAKISFVKMGKHDLIATNHNGDISLVLGKDNPDRYYSICISTFKENDSKYIKRWQHTTIRFCKAEDLLKFKEEINSEIDSFLKTIKEEGDTEFFRKEYCENTD